MVLNIDGGALARNGLTQMVLDLAELKTALGITSGRFANIRNWSRVTITYESDINQFQTKDFIFHITHPETQTVIMDKLEQYFLGNPVIASVTLHDQENGYVKFPHFLHDLSFLAVEGVLDIAPASVFFESTDGLSGKIPLEEASLWEVGWRVRVYDIINERYMDPAVSIQSVDGVTGLVTLSEPISVEPNTMVLEAPNGTRYDVTVNNSGVLSTSVTSLPATSRFNIQERRTGIKWVIKVDNAGALIIENAILDDLDLVTANDYLLRSPDANGWRLVIMPVCHYQNISGALDIERFVKQSVNGNRYEITVGNDGLFSTVLAPELSLTPAFAIKDPITGLKYASRVDNDGEVYLILDQDNNAVDEGFLLAAPNGTPYKLKSAMVNQPKMTGGIVIDTMVLQSPSGTKFKVTVDNTGALSTEDDLLATPTTPFLITQAVTGTKKIIKVDDGGTLFIETAVGDDLNYATRDTFLLASPNGTVWNMDIIQAGNLQMVSDITIRTLVLQSPNGNKFVGVMNDTGFLVFTQNNSLTATAGFKVQSGGVDYVIKITNDKRIYAAVATGAIEIAYPVINNYYMLSPNNTVWTMTVQNLPQMQSVAYAGVQTLILQAPNATKYQVLVDNAGILSTVVTALAVSERFNIVQAAFNEKYVFKVTNTGVLYLELAAGADLLLPTNNNFQLASPNATAWRLNLISITELHTEIAPTTLVNMALRFAYVDEVTLDQLSRFKFD